MLLQRLADRLEAPLSFPVFLFFVFSRSMAYILHHSTTFHAHGSGYHQIDETGMSPVAHGHSHALLGGHGNTSVRAAFIHVVGDLLQSVGVMVAAAIIYFRVRYRSHWC